VTPFQLKVAAAVALIVIGGVSLGALFLSAGSLRGWVGDRYTRVSSEAGGRSVVYSSPKRPSVVAAEIANRWKPAQRLNDPSGFFLRYSAAVIAVTPYGTGSRIHVDDAGRGYARWFPYVGGYWGTYSGPAETFRGGGPGAGK
jgi:Domain of unknown function (DUF4247)